MIEAAMGGAEFTWPAGRYVSFSGIDHIMMAMEVTITKNGSAYEEVTGTPEEMAALKKSYEHLCVMRDEVISLGVMPPIADWKKINPNL
jgi:malate dehydrogenase